MKLRNAAKLDNCAREFEKYFLCIDNTLGYPPIPKDMVYRARIKLPSNNFENNMSLNEYKSEAECKQNQASEKSKYPSEYGFHISTTSDLNFCFQKYGKNCNIFLAVKFDSILEARSKVTVESLNVGCRIRQNGPEVNDGDLKWNGNACYAMKSSTPDSIHCQCEPKSSFR